MIKFTDFSFTYKGQQKAALCNINLTINEGEKVLILGPSGSGKSTLGNCINGLIPHSLPGKIEGKAEVSGLDITKNDIFEISKKVGTVLQDTDGQFVGISTGEDIAFALENLCIEQGEMKKRVKEISSIVDMNEYLDAPPQSLSGGQKQRVSLAGVMVEETEILLFDEPLANLDPATGKKAIELIDDIHKSRKKTIIIIEHRLEDVLHRNVDRVILIKQGVVIFDDTPDTLLKSNVLEEEGIREPLYVSALKKANVDIANLEISSVETIDYNFCEKELKKWLKDNKKDNIPQKQEELIKIDNLSFSYDGIKPVLQDVSFTLHKGEMVSLLGNNGAGKSTLASILMGIYSPDKGSILINGEDCVGESIYERSDTVGYVMQNPNHMISQASIFDEVAFGLRQRGIAEDIVNEEVMAMLKLCGLEKRSKWPISVLSYGQKKRVTIASILVMKPKLLILDEPTAGQDLHHYTLLMNFIKALQRKLNITILFVTHDMHLALEYTDRSLVLSGGKLLENAKPSEVFSSPELLKQANLKETSLYTLAENCNISNISSFIQTFIESEQNKDDESEALINENIEFSKIVKTGKKRTKEKVKNKEGKKLSFGMSYIPLNSVVHRLSGVTKFSFLFIWVLMCFTTFDLRVLVFAAITSWTVMVLSKVPLKVFKPFLIAMVVITLWNALFIYLFSPDQGTLYMGTRTIILGKESMKYALSLETLWYLIVVCTKYLTIFPIALVFVSATHPSEFASSLNKIKISYKICYSFSLALRYLPDVIGDYSHISHAQMCRGVDMSSNVSLKKRIKGVGSVLAPLVLTSLDRIDIITNALMLRGFGSKKKRTWYNSTKMKASDYFALIFVFLLWGTALYLRFGQKIMFWKPF